MRADKRPMLADLPVRSAQADASIGSGGSASNHGRKLGS